MATTTVERYETPAGVALTPMAQSLALVPQAIELADRIARTSVVPPAFRGKPDELLAVMLTGDELGLGPMAAVTKIHNIEGRASLSAEVMRGLVLAHGHELWIEQWDARQCKLGAQRRGSKKESYTTWTLDDAKRAGLDGRKTWRQYPKAMLLARATGELCRALFADVLAGISYTTEELEDEELEDGILDVEEDGTVPAAIGDRPEGARPAPPDRPKTSTRSRAKTAAKKAEKPARQAVEKLASVPAGDELDEFHRFEQMAAGDVPADPDDEVVEAVIVEDDGTAEALAAEAEGGKSYPPAQALAMRAASDGLSDGQRYGLNIAISGGRAKSGKDLSSDEVHVAFGLLDLLRDGGAELVESGSGVWTVLVDGVEEYFGVDTSVDTSVAEAAPVAPDGPPDDVEGWSALRKEHRWRIADVLKAARVAGEAQGVEVPTSIRDLAAGPVELRVAVLAELGVGS